MTKILNPQKKEDIEIAGSILKNGGLVAIPTETVYGLAANALNENSVKNIYKVKGRPSDNPLIVHISDFLELEPLVKEIPKAARKLAAAFWPGPLTIILPKSDIIPSTTSGGLDTVAVRLPSNPTARAVIKASGCPLAAPSANLSGKPSPTEFKYVYDDLFGKVEAIIDGGDCSVGVESTVITLAAETPKVLRPGGITVEQLRQVLGKVDVDDAVIHKLKDSEKAASPGMKYKHYSPNADIVIADMSFEKYAQLINSSAEEIGALCFEGEEKFINKPAVTFGREYDGASQAQRLFAALYELDEKGIKKAYARCPQKTGVGLAVYNRLVRSAGFNIIKERPFIIGLTGQTGAGKTTVSGAFYVRGAGVIDCDKLTRSNKVYDSACIKDLSNAFGSEILDENGKLIRSELAKRAFENDNSKKLLNSITLPKIMQAVRNEINAYRERGANVIVLDAPTLFEAGADKLCSAIVTVIAPESIRLNRIVNRDNISPQQAKERIKAQFPQDYYTDRADFVIINTDRIDVGAEVDTILGSL